MGLVQVLDHAVQDVHAGVNGLIEALLLGANNFLDIGFMLAQFGVTNLAGDDNGIHQISQGMLSFGTMCLASSITTATAITRS